jgi:starch phosphorylase
VVRCSHDCLRSVSRHGRGRGERRIKTGTANTASPSRRSSLADGDFRAAVVEHVVHTCAKELRDASAFDFYHAFAHTVRDRLVHRWLATQRTHVART